jgi:hypothetical protein
VQRHAAVLAIAASLFCATGFAAPPVGIPGSPAIPRILAAAETLFQSMKERRYTETWAVLTRKSRETIVSETDDAIRRAGSPPVPKERIRDDFAAGGPLCRQYWEGFLRRFDPDDALEKSRWEMGGVEQNRAEVLITHIGADRPAVLQMFQEEGGWKVGLVETFWEH